MRNVTVARRYARALYQLSMESKSLEDVLLGLNNLTHALTSSPEMSRLLLNPLVEIELKQKLIGSVSSNKLILKFTALLARRKRLDFLQSIYELLLGMSDQAAGLHRALIKTVMPLTEAQKKSVESDLAKRVGGKIIGKFEVAKDLIGGVWIKMGDKVLDATLKGRIETFQQALRHSTN